MALSAVSVLHGGYMDKLHFRFACELGIIAYVTLTLIAAILLVQM